ncbi:hypothetical protein GCM10027614_73470 [Micromonospora vulcania]
MPDPGAPTETRRPRRSEIARTAPPPVVTRCSWSSYTRATASTATFPGAAVGSTSAWVKPSSAAPEPTSRTFSAEAAVTTTVACTLGSSRLRMAARDRPKA